MDVSTASKDNNCCAAPDPAKMATTNYSRPIPSSTTNCSAAPGLQRQNAVRRSKVRRTLPTIDEVLSEQWEAENRRMFPNARGHDNATYTVSPRFYENFIDRPETVRSASIVEEQGFRASVKARAKRMLLCG